MLKEERIWMAWREKRGKRREDVEKGKVGCEEVETGENRDSLERRENSSSFVPYFL